jgi:hypothetical protein
VTPGDDQEEEAPDSGPRLSEAVRDRIPDVRDGLTRVERIVLLTLQEAQAEKRGRNVPTAMLYGRVAERIDISQEEFMRVLTRLIGTRA